eukprot:14339090-Alexandrium_andersonii.AAC.1
MESAGSFGRAGRRLGRMGTWSAAAPVSASAVLPAASVSGPSRSGAVAKPGFPEWSRGEGRVGRHELLGNRRGRELLQGWSGGDGGQGMLDGGR